MKKVAESIVRKVEGDICTENEVVDFYNQIENEITKKQRALDIIEYPENADWFDFFAEMKIIQDGTMEAEKQGYKMYHTGGYGENGSQPTFNMETPTHFVTLETTSSSVDFKISDGVHVGNCKITIYKK